MSQILVKVTQEDIEKAKRKDSSKCVVAQAIARTIKDATMISVDVQSIRFTNGAGERLVYLTPPAASGYVVAFDAGDELHPFNFRLNNDRVMRTQRKVRTPVARELDKVNAQKRATRRRAVKVQENPASLPAEVLAAEARAEVAAAEAASVRAAYEAAGVETRDVRAVDDPALPPPVRRTFKSNVRHYGHRTLRINQAADQ